MTRCCCLVSPCTPRGCSPVHVEAPAHCGCRVPARTVLRPLAPHSLRAPTPTRPRCCQPPVVDSARRSLQHNGSPAAVCSSEAGAEYRSLPLAPRTPRLVMPRPLQRSAGSTQHNLLVSGELGSALVLRSRDGGSGTVCARESSTKQQNNSARADGHTLWMSAPARASSAKEATSFASCSCAVSKWLRATSTAAKGAGIGDAGTAAT